MSPGPGNGLGGYIAALTPGRDHYWGLGLGLVQFVNKPSPSWHNVVPSDRKPDLSSILRLGSVDWCIVEQDDDKDRERLEEEYFWRLLLLHLYCCNTFGSFIFMAKCPLIFSDYVFSSNCFHVVSLYPP